MDPEFQRKRLPHDVPHWISPTQEIYFVTVVCQPRHTNQLANPNTWQHVLQSIDFREERGDWTWRLLLAMPDHLHGIVSCTNQFKLTETMANWKRWTARKHGIIWQHGFFEHRLRSVESAAEKGNYIRMNPLRAGLVDHPADWPYVRDWKSNQPA